MMTISKVTSPIIFLQSVKCNNFRFKRILKSEIVVKGRQIGQSQRA